MSEAKAFAEAVSKVAQEYNMPLIMATCDGRTIEVDTVLDHTDTNRIQKLLGGIARHFGEKVYTEEKEED